MTGPSAVPAALDAHHVLAVPRGTDVVALARAWFPGARWAREPATAEQTAAVRPVAGARFRGMVVAAPPAAGLVTLDGAVELPGPYPLDARDAYALGLPGHDADLYGLPAAPVAGATVGPDLVTGWATAVARHVHGGILPVTRDRAVVPDPAVTLDLTLWSPVPLDVDDALARVRPALTGSRLTAPPAPAPGGPQRWTLTARYQYDGQVVVRCARSRQVPVVLSTLDWREHGPWGYQVAWEPPDLLGHDASQPSALHAVARQRVAPGVARSITALRTAVGGTVVDAGGFVVTPEALAALAVAR